MRSDGLFDGALASLAGGIGAVGAVLLFMTIEAFALTGNVGASTSIGAYFSFATMFILIPLFTIEGMGVGAVGVFLRERLSRKKSTVTAK